MRCPGLSFGFVVVSVAVVAISCASNAGVALESRAVLDPETQTGTRSKLTTPTEDPDSSGAQSEGGSSEAAPVAGDAAVSPGQPFALGLGETAVLEDGLAVSFESVVGESRCPEDLDCIWEGNAEIAIEAAKIDEDPTSLRLNTNPSLATEASYLGYTIQLIDLEPYPRSDTEPGEPYRATLTVSSDGE